MERLKTVVGLGLIVTIIICIQSVNANPVQHHSNTSTIELTGTLG